MTLPTSKLGGRGQRYEIRFTRQALKPSTASPKTVHILGWAKTFEGAQKMREAWSKNHEVDRAWIVDHRKPPHPAGAKYRILPVTPGKVKIIFA